MFKNLMIIFLFLALAIFVAKPIIEHHSGVFNRDTTPYPVVPTRDMYPPPPIVTPEMLFFEVDEIVPTALPVPNPSVLCQAPLTMEHANMLSGMLAANPTQSIMDTYRAKYQTQAPQDELCAADLWWAANNLFNQVSAEMSNPALSKTLIHDEVYDEFNREYRRCLMECS